jgi:uncharacterized membrane protein YedE/YeeE
MEPTRSIFFRSYRLFKDQHKHRSFLIRTMSKLFHWKPIRLLLIFILVKSRIAMLGMAWVVARLSGMAGGRLPAASLGKKDNPCPERSTCVSPTATANWSSYPISGIIIGILIGIPPSLPAHKRILSRSP